MATACDCSQDAMSSKHCCTSSSFMSPSLALVIAGKDPLETSIEADSDDCAPTREQQAVSRRIFFYNCLEEEDRKQGHFGVDVSGASNLAELNMVLGHTVMIRRLKRDVLTQLPHKRRQQV